MKMLSGVSLCLAVIGSSVVGLRPAVAQEASLEIALADGKLALTAPEGWVRQQPRSRIVEHEFSVPAAEGDEQDGRVTVMGAGGSIEDNIARWCDQFLQPDGADSREKALVEELNVAGQSVVLVDISGTYLDKPFPMAREFVEREGYRMLGAIIRTEKLGNYFVKFYGPAHTVTNYEDAFQQMVEQLQVR